VISATAGGAGDLSLIGVWATEGATSHVKIDECGGKLCGAIVWLKEPLNKEARIRSIPRIPIQGFVCESSSAFPY